MGRIAHYTVLTRQFQPSAKRYTPGKCSVKYHNLCSGLGTGCLDYFSVVDENSYSFIGRQAKFWRVLVGNGPLRADPNYRAWRSAVVPWQG
jgi:hypothetical protein